MEMKGRLTSGILGCVLRLESSGGLGTDALAAGSGTLGRLLLGRRGASPSSRARPPLGARQNWRTRGLSSAAHAREEGVSARRGKCSSGRTDGPQRARGDPARAAMVHSVSGGSSFGGDDLEEPALRRTRLPVVQAWSRGLCSGSDMLRYRVSSLPGQAVLE
ncbi:extensin [Iris pallida]|uniref:Extensin n=1 Tax=Iris pallida TaxID=29817 RepID=A0AAX6GDZ6_IRIPA|nr:extensin [Iris pallida]